jgi:hypothetical protein
VIWKRARDGIEMSETNELSPLVGSSVESVFVPTSSVSTSKSTSGITCSLSDSNIRGLDDDDGLYIESTLESQQSVEDEQMIRETEREPEREPVATNVPCSLCECECE